MVPAVIATSTSTGGLNPPRDGDICRAVDVSGCVALGDFQNDRHRGIAGIQSPPPLPDDVPPGRNTVVRNTTGAAITGLGGEDRSVTRTTTG